MKARERVATWGSALPARSQRSTFGLRVSYIALSAYSPPPLLTEERSGRSEARADALSGALRVGRASCAAIASRIWALLAGRGTGSAAAEMSYGSSSIASGAKTATRTFDFGRTHVVRPKGRHLATVVWLHGLGDNGASWSQLLETLPLPNITRFDVTDLSEDGPDDIEGLDASAAHVANLLSTEPADIKLGVGGFSMGAATALYSATSCAHGTYGNGKPYPVNLSSVVGLSGWLPCARSLKSKLEGSQDAARRASSLPILLCHGKGDEVVLYKHGERSAQVLKSNRFENVTFKTYNGLGHYTVPGEMDDVCKFLTATLGLDGSHS
ncbi:acyl-protein thioesterase [Musa troglodytarum]|uniref:Acyl-protein thioesterase n=1 Tax=Musa troglodytarum TaxID=320322 RepID=A0A9E7G7H2_9LILI|nr:acyl-protein thioesterase [Musa troglodytarum]